MAKQMAQLVDVFIFGRFSWFVFLFGGGAEKKTNNFLTLFVKNLVKPKKSLI